VHLFGFIYESSYTPTYYFSELFPNKRTAQNRQTIDWRIKPSQWYSSQGKERELLQREVT